MASFQKTITQLLLRLPGGLQRRMAGGAPRELGGRIVDPALQLVWANATRQAAPRPTDPAELRETLNRDLALLAGAPRPLAAVEHMQIQGADGEIPARLYRPRAHPSPAPLLLFFHQGGFVIGTLDWSEAFCSLLADEAGCLVLSIDYRLAPEHPFPAAHQDALSAWRWAQEQGPRLGADPACVAVGGDSAGGNLAAVICQETRSAEGHVPRLQLLIYPWLECRPRVASRQTFAEAWPLDAALMDWFTQHALRKDEDHDHAWMNPLHAPDLSGLPPALIYSAGFDPLCDEGSDYAARLRAAGVTTSYRCFDALTHSFTALGAVPACQRAQLEIARAFARELSPLGL